jgi:putative ABC transport system permease protein
LQIGDILELNDKRAIVVGYVKSLRNFTLQPKAYTTYERAISYAPSDRRYLTYILVKSKYGSDLIKNKELIARIEENKDLKAYTHADFRDLNYLYWLKNTGVPINFGISVLLGFLVGAAIVGQTFFSFVYENLKQYAVLKAMGAQNSVLMKMVLVQAVVVGALGYGIGVGFTTLFGLQILDTVLAFRMPPILLLFAALGVFLIVSISAFFGIRQVIKVDPAVVFRT